MPISQNQTDALYAATVTTHDGDDLGAVTQIYLDDATGEPAWATVNTGFFGTRETFIPLTGAELHGNQITVSHSKSTIKDAPRVDADDHLSDSDQDELYAYYGLQGSPTSDTSRGTGGEPTSNPGPNPGPNSDSNRDSNRGSDSNPNSNPGPNSDAMTLHEERVDVGTTSVETGRIRLRKHVVTEQESVTVPVQREEFEVVREPATGAEPGTDRLGEDEVSVTTHEERPVIDKEVVATEQVGLDRRVIDDEQQVSTDVSHEEVDVEREQGRGGQPGKGDNHRS